MKGQLFSSDFIISVVIFSAAIMLLLPLWNDINYQIADAEAKKDLQIAVSSISDLLVKSPGSPSNWTPTDVKSLGLSNTRRVINLTKFESLRQLNYSAVKALLGIYQYNLTINITDEYGLLATSGISRSPVAYFSAEKEELKALIAYSGLTWDYYWGHDLPATEPDHADARFFYSGSKADTLNALLVNASSRKAYRTIIVEEPDLALSDVNATALLQFLLGGGRFILEGKGYAGNLILDGFGVQSYSGANANGIVLKSDWFVRAQNGSSASFQDSQWAVYGMDPGALTIEIADTLNNSRGLVAWWGYGTGRLYYITDANGSTAGRLLTDVLNIAGEKLEYGVYPSNAKNIVISNRLVVIEGDSDDGRQFGRMRLVIWE